MKFVLANSSLLLFAKFLDTNFFSKWSEEWKELAELMFGGVEAVRYSKEIELLASFSFYLPTIFFSDFTIGQSFLDLKQYRLVDKDAIVSCQWKDRLFTAFLYAFLPYLYNKKLEIWNLVVETGKILVHSEDNGSVAEELSISTGNMKTSYLTIAWKALHNSIKSISSETETILERVFSFIYELHMWSFFVNGKYGFFLFLSFTFFLISFFFCRFLEIPLRLSQKLLFVQKPPVGPQSKLKSLAWLVSFRLSLLLYYVVRVFFTELDNQLTLANATDGKKVTATDPQTVKNPEEENDATLDSARNHSQCCPLCLDDLKEPAVIPCGHLACWNCLFNYALKGGGNNRASTSTLSTHFVKCPVCRFEFLPQQIRPVYL
jgi:hypothetical protein